MYLNSYSRVLVFKEFWPFQRGEDNFYLKWVENIVIQFYQLKQAEDSRFHAPDSGSLSLVYSNR